MATLSSLISALSGKSAFVANDKIPFLDSDNAGLFNWITYTNLSAAFPLLVGRSGGQTIIGGTAVGDALNLQGTSANGTPSAAAINFKVGNNGGTTALSILNNGNIGIGVTPGVARLAVKSTASMNAATLSEELLSTSGWTVGAGWAESPDDVFAHSSGTATLEHSAVVTGSTNYVWSITIASRTAGSVTVSLGGKTYSEIEATYTGYTVTTSTAAFIVTPTTDFNGTISLMTLKSVSTDHLPTLQIIDTNDAPAFEIRASVTKNMFIGDSAGENSLQASEYNVAIGSSAGQNIMSGSYNLLIGANAGESITSGSSNIVVGTLSLDKLINGSDNVAIGGAAGRFLNNGSSPLERANNSIYIGSGAKGFATNETNAIVIGSNALGLGSNTVVIGNSSTITNALFGKIGLNTTSPSAALHIVKTTEQLRLAYDGSNLCSFTVGSTGILTVSAPTVFSGAVSAASVKAPLRVYSVADAATLTPDIDSYDLVEVYNQTTNSIAFANPTGTPTNGQMLYIRFYGEYTTFTFDTAYAPGVNAFYTESTANRQMWMTFQYVSRSGKWQQYYRATSAT